MSERTKQIMAGGSGISGAILRAAMAIAEPVYASGVAVRNLRYNKTGGASLARPVISVGNITTGGTGKTPIVRWLAEAMRQRGLRPAILMRGYRANEQGMSDEATMLQRQLPGVLVRANPNRIQSGRELLECEPGVDVLLLDDGFQHRQLARDFDLVLIDATNPFGFGHVLPRGLLREALTGLKRASAFLITRAGHADGNELAKIEQTLKRYNATASVYRSNHHLTTLPEEKVFAFAGIGNPKGFEKQLADSGKLVGSKWFADHHAYSESDIADLRRTARDAGAACLVTTEKDWVKIEPMVGSGGLPIVPLGLRIQFHGDDEQRLLEQILRVVPKPGELMGRPSAEYSRDKSMPPRQESMRP